MERAMKYFLKNLLGQEIFTSMVSWDTKSFLKNLQNPLPPYILNLGTLIVVDATVAADSLLGEMTARSPRERGNVTLVHPMS